ncbi:unnamed protein product [Adineta steineri]|uniref:Sugar phosphate transporter domain-containing protein n=1 Tax=Adineta steineri TaxID=433720 RepID=A0A818UVD0_9BILA|nr:unnamed protein product [Adineta steineri]CAF3706537.1 unnamed protein product [Adineta steineri]
MQKKSSSDVSSSQNVSFIQRVFSAVLYGTCSGLITVVNKLVLTSYGFPSFQLLAIGQLVVSIIVLYVARLLNIVHFPPFSKDIIKKIMPLPLFFFLNLFFGLGGTQAVSLPMFTALRRFSIWMAMIGEQFILKQQQPFIAQASVYLMVIGALIASGDDLTFNWFGYTFLTLNNLSTTAQGIVIKQKLANQKFNQNDLLFYNSFVVLIPTILLALCTEDLNKVWNYDGYRDIGFICAFLLSSIMGFLLNYSVMLCTKYNSPLTTTVVGACKNLFVTYLGMFIGGDYIFSFVNFIGLNISALGSIIYTWITFTRKTPSTVIPNKRKENEMNVDDIWIAVL